MQLREVALEALFVAEGIFTDNGVLVGMGLAGYRNEILGLPADLLSQLRTTLIHNVFLDLVLLNLNGSP